MNSAPAVQAESSTVSKPRVKRVPKGTSAYQAAWIVDDDEADDDDDDDLGSDMETDAGENGDSPHHCTSLGQALLIAVSDEEEMEEIELDTREQQHDDMAPEEEEEQ